MEKEIRPNGEGIDILWVEYICPKLSCTTPNSPRDDHKALERAPFLSNVKLSDIPKTIPCPSCKGPMQRLPVIQGKL